MNDTNLLEQLQRIIETAEILVQAIPEEAMDDLWLQEIVDASLIELNKSIEILKDRYDLDLAEIDGEFLTNTEFNDVDDQEFMDKFDEPPTEYDAFDFEEEDN